MDNESTQHDEKETPLRQVADPSSELSAVKLAVRILGTAGEPAQFWADIANNAAYRDTHRRLAVFALFDRHVEAGMTLAELAAMLAEPTWLADDDVTVVETLAGKIPVRWTLEDTVFALLVFPGLEEPGEGPWAIYLRVAEKVNVTEFNALVHVRAASPNTAGALLLEVALAPPLQKE